MYEPDPEVFRLDDETRRQRLAEGGLVHVSVHRGDGADRLELLEERRRRQVADVEDQVGALEEPKASRRQATCPARQVRVSDQRYQRNSGRKAPSW